MRQAITSLGSVRAAGRLLGIPESTIRFRLRKSHDDSHEVDETVQHEVAIGDLLRERFDKFARLKDGTHDAFVRTVRLKTNDPIGVGFFGDAHVDDDGTNLKKLFEHVDIFDGRTAGLYGAFLGDVANNWVGRLERLWADQSVNHREAFRLVEFFFKSVSWLFVVHGNHDVWNQKLPLYDYILQSQTKITAAHEQRVRLVFPNKREVMIHARHKFPGHSQWTKQFGQIKAAMLGGNADIYIGGDKHVSGYSAGWHDGQKRMFHAIQVASYKEIDEYPVELGLSPADLFQCPVAIINPNTEGPLNFIRWEFDPHEGAERLTWERDRWSNA
jgi:hypothetical protein